MVLYYTASQKTKVFAEALGEALEQPVYELKSPLNDKNPFAMIMLALYLAVTGKAYPVSNMPELDGVSELTLCSPVWGGNIAGPAWYFLNNADLKNKTVNLLITCGSGNSLHKYKKKALDSLRLTDCVPGGVMGFITTNDMPERDVALEQIREMLPFNQG